MKSENENTTDDSVPVKSFSIVGIGASAGGLEAIGELLKNLPPDTGMAFVFVQHLAPNHTSILSEILSKKTEMPVTDAKEGASLEPNHVYVIPPNTTLTVGEGRLHLTQRNDKQGIPMPIDDLFHSLAEDQKFNAIGISLSGAGTDGALGMQSIKNEGGITFAQDASAEYTSMPQAAVGLGCVDFVLPPAEIAQELARISRHPLRISQSALNFERLNSDDESLKKIFILLQGGCDMDFTHYKRGTIKRRLIRRLALRNMDNFPDYIKFLQGNPEEVKALCEDFFIRVTRFFRDPDVFEGFSKYVVPHIIEGHSSKAPLRIWVPGCSTGEEVYSIAICCLEYIAEHGLGVQIQIFGTDVSEAALQIARTGIYVENIARDVSPKRLNKFFAKTGDRFQVEKSVRDLCIFARHDVTRDPPYSRLDLVSCRNLLIYLEPSLQKRVIPLFHYALKPEGVLLISSAENIGGFADIFTVKDYEGIKFYTKKSLPVGSQLKYLADYSKKSAHAVSQTSPQPDPSKKRYTEAEQQKREADRITLGRYVPAAVLCDKSLNIIEFRGDTSLYLTQPSGPPDTNLRKLARPGLFVEISKAVHKADKEDAPVRRDDLKVETSVGNRDIALEVFPVQGAAADDSWFLIFFEDKIHAALPPPHSRGFWSGLGKLVFHALKPVGRNMQQYNDELSRVRQELSNTHDHIRMMMDEYETAKEELQSSREELLSSNEEFQSTNEELETAKEELQSANEELLTTNEEVHHRNHELTELNDKLQQTLNYIEVIIKTISQPFLVLDGDLHILRANQAFYRTFKTAPEKTERRLLYDLGDRQWDIPELRQFLQALIMKDTSFKDCEITHDFPHVGSKTMRLNATHLVWEKHTQILLAIEDVTDYKRALNTLKDNDLRKDEFLGMLAHELRNPLAPIRNALEIWKRGDAGEKIEQEAQKIMERQLLKMVRLVDDLLDIARITRGVIAIKKDPVDLVAIVQQTVESTRHHLEGRQHKFSLSVPDDKVLVKGDAIRLEQIISNLLINASKYTEPGGHISLILTQEAGQARIRVIDDGLGISPELLPQIFDLFVQAERSLDRHEGGLGIGLTLVRRLVELQGGTVEVKSPGLKKGSEFIVRLPLLPATETSVPPPPRPSKPPPMKHRILIVEDNVDAAKTTQMLLELCGHTIQTAIDGPAGIKIAQTFKPEVVLLDIGLPGMDGYKVAQHLRALPETKNALLIALSGYGQTEDMQKSKEAGFDHHLVKPADMERLQELISGPVNPGSSS